jgi:hypothetical protein
MIVLLVDFKLITKAMPDKKNLARSIAIWQLSMTLPSVIASPLAGVIITSCNKLWSSQIISKPHVGYILIFALCAALQVGSAIAMALVRTDSTTHGSKRFDKEKDPVQLNS